MDTPAQEPTPQAPTFREHLIAALGLPADTFMLEFVLSDTQQPVVRCHFYPTAEALQQAVLVLSEYVLAPKPQEAPVPPEPFVAMEET